MEKFEAGKLGADFFPQFPDAEIAFVYLRIVEQNDRARRQLPRPGFVVVLHIVIKMTPVDMKKINRSILKIIQRFVEGCFEEA